LQPSQQRDTGGGKRWLLLISAILMLVLSAVIYIQFHQSSLLSNTLRFEEDNIYWNFFELETESYRLREALQKRKADSASIDAEDVQLRLDIFYSRYGVLKEGKGFRLISEYQENAEALEKTAHFFQAFAPYFDDGGAGNLTGDSLQQMLEELEALREPLHDLSLAANMMAGARAQYAATEVKRQITISTGLILFQCALVMLFSYIVIRQIRQLENGQAHLSMLAGQLEQSNTQLEERAAALTRALQEADRSYAELSTYMQAIDQHAQVTVVELDGRIAQVNDKFCEVSGYRREELSGRDYRLLNSGLHPDFFFADLWKAVGRGEIWRDEICNRTKDGALYWLDTTIVPLKDEQGKPVRYISVSIDVTRQKEAELRISELAGRDGLTGLPNRNLLLDRLRQALARDRDEGSKTAVIFIDLDDFRSVNNMLGSDAADRVLNEAASRLSDSVRAQDTVARLGGDEFVVVLPGMRDAEQTLDLVRQIMAALREPYVIADTHCMITASLGVALCPDDGADEGTLLKRSDIAMHHVKANGRDNFRFCSGDSSSFAGNGPAVAA
jgi:diguanylate cyclase (GGDEF)-like protein/PAS domain S-box-containing protein